MKRFFLLFFVMITITCGVKQPVDQRTPQDFGSIFVTSTPPGGLIYLDGRNTERATPDTLHYISTGYHTVRLFLEEYLAAPDSIVVKVAANTTASAIFTLDKLTSTGWVIIESKPAGAEIIVDNQPSGTFTPDSLLLQSGAHTIVLQKNGYKSHSWQIEIQRDTITNLAISLTIQPCILLEAFGNVSCDPCVIAAENLDVFAEHPDPAAYAIMEYYANWPSPNDPFYKQAPQDVKQRLQDYQITALPSLYIGGLYSVDATHYSEIYTAFHSALAAHATPIGLSIVKKLLGTELTVRVESIWVSTCENLEQLRLYVAIVENAVHFASPPGSNGLTDFDFVFRGFISDRTGDQFDASQRKQDFLYRLAWRDWNYDNSPIIAFIQNKETKQIIHTTIH